MAVRAEQFEAEVARLWEEYENLRGDEQVRYITARLPHRSLRQTLVGVAKRLIDIIAALGGLALTLPLAPLLIGFILGRMLEDNFARSMQLYDGVSFIIDRPMTLGLLVVAILLVVVPSYRARRARARQAGIADGD